VHLRFFEFAMNALHLQSCLCARIVSVRVEIELGSATAFARLF